MISSARSGDGSRYGPNAAATEKSGGSSANGANARTDVAANARVLLLLKLRAGRSHAGISCILLLSELLAREVGLLLRIREGFGCIQTRERFAGSGLELAAGDLLRL